MVEKFSGEGNTATALIVTPQKVGENYVTTPYSYEIHDNPVRQKINDIIDEIALIPGSLVAETLTDETNDLTEGNYEYIIDATSNDVTANMPASPSSMKEFPFVKSDSTANKGYINLPSGHTLKSTAYNQAELNDQFTQIKLKFLFDTYWRFDGEGDISFHTV